MSLSDALTIIQAVILLLTGLVVAWYAHETSEIRKETSKQNALLAEQLLSIQQAQEYERQKDISFIRPVFRCDGGNYNVKEASLKFTNCGSIAKNISIEPKGQFRAKISPSSLGINEKGEIKLEDLPQPLPKELNFAIHYEDKLGNKGTQCFRYLSQKGEFIEDCVNV